MNPFFTPRHQKCRSINKTAQIWLFNTSLSIHSNLLWTAELNQMDKTGDSLQLNVQGCHVFGVREFTQFIWQLRDFHADARTNFITDLLKLHVPPSPPLPPFPETYYQVTAKGNRFNGRLKLNKTQKKSYLYFYCHAKLHKRLYNFTD